MKLKLLLGILFSITMMKADAQYQKRKVSELINAKDSAWPEIREMMKSAKNKVEVLPVDATKAEDALYKSQVTTRSPMGAIVYETGGILIDNGWVRILASGSSKLNRSLPDWNKGKSFSNWDEVPKFLLIADDAVGGFFMLNGGQLGEDQGKIYYFSPDNLNFEALNITYTEFLQFCFYGDLPKFYANLRWKNWKDDLTNLSPDEAFNFFPFLWTKEGKDIDKNSRKKISVEEQYQFNIEQRKTLGLK